MFEGLTAVLLKIEVFTNVTLYLWVNTDVSKERNRIIVTPQLIFESLAVTLHTTRFKIKKILRGAHIAFMCFVRISEQTATFAL
jgi:hypothetical protein